VPKLFAALMFSLLTVCAHATAPAAAADAALEQRVAALAGELRCVVCQNQTLADSHAELAIDLKQRIREKLAQGQSEREVIDFMVQRYGDFVLYRPPLKGSTAFLWFGPLVLLAGGFAMLARALARQGRAPAALPASEQQRAAALLDSSDTRGTP
jgi:cytochrome c-type biogenesis protein CcmH